MKVDRVPNIPDNSDFKTTGPAYKELSMPTKKTLYTGRVSLPNKIEISSLVHARIEFVYLIL